VGIARRNGKWFARVLAVTSVMVAAVGASGAGVASASDAGVSAAVVGGRAVAPGEFPTLAAILLDDPSIPARDRFMCSGTVLARRWVLSAGHCGIAPAFGERIVAQVGSSDVGDPAATNVRINRVVIHRAFAKRATGSDVALFHLEHAVAGPRVRLAGAADLPLAAAGRDAVLVGWGLTTKLAIMDPPPWDAQIPVRARAATVPIVDDEVCASAYRDFARHYFVSRSDLCAGAEGRSACYGDSGGPLFARDPRGALVEIGITSRGAGCAPRLFPAIFTDVRRVHGWIRRWTTRPCTTPFDFGIPGLPALGPVYAC
jgi:secreted trypsin-like serine protease